ncbi:TPA: hypothetical protein DCY67_02760 [Candidatus Acetothermia bacterium]|nr:hypothetical protein [Candidatus Acetothermia bacterium]
MRVLAVGLVLFAVGAVSQVPLSPPPAPEAVLAFLQTMAISPEVKAALGPVLGAGLATGRATPHVSLLLLRRLSELPPAQAEQVLAVFPRALERGFIVDTGLAGSSLMNDVLKLLMMGHPWELVVSNLWLRYSLLVAAQEVLLEHRVIGPGAQGPGGPLLPQDRLVLETAWAVGDFMLAQRREPMEAFVRARLLNLRDSVLPASTVDPLLAVLTPELVQEIERRAFQPERR